MRNINTVIEQILACVPESEISFRETLKRFSRSWSYSSPEGAPMQWASLSMWLYYYLNTPRADEWTQEIARIMSGAKPKRKSKAKKK